MLATFRRRRQRSGKKRRVRGAVQLAGGALAGRVALQSGVPRLLGARLERHTTSRENWSNIRKSGGMLDPSYGGSDRGASAQAGRTHGTEAKETFLRTSKGYVHVTGRNTGNPLLNTGYRKLQSRLYGTVLRSGGKRPKTLYIPGTDQYFQTEFEVDPYDLALRTQKKVRAYGNRYSATLAHVKEQGLANSMKANKGRVLAGAAILGVGGYGSYRMGRLAVNNLTGRKPSRRRRQNRRRRNRKLRRLIGGL